MRVLRKSRISFWLKERPSLDILKRCKNNLRYLPPPRKKKKKERKQHVFSLILHSSSSFSPTDVFIHKFTYVFMLYVKAITSFRSIYTLWTRSKELEICIYVYTYIWIHTCTAKQIHAHIAANMHSCVRLHLQKLLCAFMRSGHSAPPRNGPSCSALSECVSEFHVVQKQLIHALSKPLKVIRSETDVQWATYLLPGSDPLTLWGPHLPQVRPPARPSFGRR